MNARLPAAAFFICSLPLAFAATAPSADALRAAADYSARHGGASVLVMHEGKMVFERYEAGCDATTAFDMHSGTKGFWGPVIAAMIEDGLVNSFDELASVTLPEWREDARRHTITLRHLLELSAGLAQDLPALQGNARTTLAPDLYTHAIKLAIVTAPGQRFVYGPSCYYALGEVMKRKLALRKQTPLEYLRARILQPIGVETGAWIHDQSGNPHIPNGGSITARNWARYGQFLLQQGEWEGKQIIRKELMLELRQPCKANPGHGLAIWLNQPGGFAPTTQRSGNLPDSARPGFIYPDGEPDLFAAMGAQKNRLYIFPQRSLVVVRQSRDVNDTMSDAEFIRLILGGEASVPTASDRLGLIFTDLDKNRDGKLDEEEAGVRPFFRPADANKDGVVTLDEVRHFFRQRARDP